MAGGGEEVGKVFVTIEAQGAENVAKEINRAKAMASIPVSGFTQMPAWAGNAGSSSTMTMGGGGAGPIKATTDAFKEQARVLGSDLPQSYKKTESAAKTLRQELVSVRQGIFGTVSIIGTFVTGIVAAIQGMIGFKNAARDVSDSLRDINEGLNITTTAGQSDFDTLTKSAQKYHEQIKRGIDIERESSTELLNALLSNSEIRADITADGLKVQIADSDMLALKEAQNNSALKEDLEDINTLETNRLALAKERVSFKESSDYLKEFNKEVEATIAAQRKAELSELDGAARIRKQRDFDIEDLQKKKSVTEDNDTRELIDKQIAAREQIAAADIRIADKTQQEKDTAAREAADREIQRAQEVAQRSAAAFVDAWQSAQRSLLDSNAGTSKSMLQLLTKVDNIARSLGRLG